MAKHVYLTNLEGGYFYRIYPKLSQLKFDDKNPVQADMFNPLPEYGGYYTCKDIYGKFIDKYNDQGLVVELHSSASILFTCLLTGTQEERILNSRSVIKVPDHIYNYNFIKNNIYSISLKEVKLIQ